MFQYGVDIAFWAHEHSYERTFPVYNMTVMNGTGSDPYEDPGATVHIINGAPGNRCLRHLSCVAGSLVGHCARARA